MRTRTGHIPVVSMDVKIAGFLRKAYNQSYAIIIRIGNCATGCVCTIDRIQLYQSGEVYMACILLCANWQQQIQEWQNNLAQP